MGLTPIRGMNPSALAQPTFVIEGQRGLCSIDRKWNCKE
jgi:hypothetical protein